MAYIVLIVEKGCGKIKLNDLIEAYKVCKGSGFRVGKTNLIEEKSKLLNSKCVVISCCYECPHYKWHGEGFCSKACQDIVDKNEIASFCPLSNFKDWEQVLWGKC